MIMLEMITECDVCGLLARAKPVSDYRNDVYYIAPDGWKTIQFTSRKTTLCPICADKLKRGDDLT